jgi:myo-inositol-1(or 4)-monophosphatase
VLDDDAMLSLLHDAAQAVADALGGVDDWGLSGQRPTQYRHDLVADEAVLGVLRTAGVTIVSEESGRHEGSLAREVTVVVDPVDGSTNASSALRPWATSLCALDGAGPWAALVVDQTSGVRFSALRGHGAELGLMAPAGRARPLRAADALVGLSGFPARHLGWRQFRCFGASALELCYVAGGLLDAYVECTLQGIAPWDYLGAWLVCQESGVTVLERQGRELVVVDHAARRSPVAGATPELAAELLERAKAAGPALRPDERDSSAG